MISPNWPWYLDPDLRPEPILDSWERSEHTQNDLWRRTL